ncbi:MAG: hypothetical protein NZM04_09580 [Methylacidiphilales bacterium]|nr:hypothetical protein [Candidatus Methylacidiphilales bacterium]
MATPPSSSSDCPLPRMFNATRRKRGKVLCAVPSAHPTQSFAKHHI